jgi:hypothetical protein
MDAIRSAAAGLKPATGDDCLLSTGRHALTAERIYHDYAPASATGRQLPRDALAPYFRDLSA